MFGQMHDVIFCRRSSQEKYDNLQLTTGRKVTWRKCSWWELAPHSFRRSVAADAAADGAFIISADTVADAATAVAR